MTKMQPLNTIIAAIKRGDREALDQLIPDLLTEDKPVDIDWSMEYNEGDKTLKVNWDIHVLLEKGFVPFVSCTLKQKQDKKDIAWCMDLRNTEIKVTGNQGDYCGWLNTVYVPVSPVEVTAEIFGWANAPDTTSKFFMFEKTIKI
ncbi:hypothetical protein ACFLRT_00835 [Acidobacteriota bacterium]